MKREKQLARIIANPRNVRFLDLCHAVESAGFVFKRQAGSHRFYAHPTLKVAMNIQDSNGMAKPYQARQFIELIRQLGVL